MNDPIYIFDGDCILCSRSVKYMLAHEVNPVTRFIAIQSVEGRDIANQHGIDPENPQSFLYIADGKVFKTSDALIEIARRVRGPASIFRALAIVPRPARNLFYHLIAKNRYKIFGREANCMVLQPEHAHRFVLS